MDCKRKTFHDTSKSKNDHPSSHRSWENSRVSQEYADHVKKITTNVDNSLKHSDETLAKIKEKKEDIIKIVKEIPIQIISDLNKSAGNSKYKDMVTCYGKNNPFNETYLQLLILSSHIENIKLCRLNKLTDDSKIGEAIIEANQLLNQLNVNISAIKAFHLHIKSQLENLGL